MESANFVQNKKTSEPTAPAVEAPKADDVDDLFSEPKAGDKSAMTAPTNSMRRWTDNTGKYHVNARLVMVSQTHVRLLKENGRYTTLRFSRLSQADHAFVHQNWTGGIASW